MRDATPIKLLLVESGRAVGGTERVVWELATRLPEARFDVRVWLSDDPGVDELAAALEQADVGVDRVAEVESRWDWKGMFATWSKLRALKPDLVHIHHVWPAADRYLSMVARAAGVSHVVVTEHIMGESHSRGQRALKRDELKNADAVTAVTGAIVDTLVRDYGIERSLVRVIPNGADLPDEEREAPLARRWRERFLASPLKPLWVVAGRLEALASASAPITRVSSFARRLRISVRIIITGLLHRHSATPRSCDSRGPRRGHLPWQAVL